MSRNTAWNLVAHHARNADDQLAQTARTMKNRVEAAIEAQIHQGYMGIMRDLLRLRHVDYALISVDMVRKVAPHEYEFSHVKYSHDVTNDRVHVEGRDASVPVHSVQLTIGINHQFTDGDALCAMCDRFLTLTNAYRVFSITRDCLVSVEPRSPLRFDRTEDIIKESRRLHDRYESYRISVTTYDPIVNMVKLEVRYGQLTRYAFRHLLRSFADIRMSLGLKIVF